MNLKSMIASVSLATMCLYSFASAGLNDISAAQILAADGVIQSKNLVDDYRLRDTITRKEMMKIVMKLSGKEVNDVCEGKFGDVSNDWGCKYIESALSYGFVAANENFRPNDTITKAESMKLVLKARGLEKSQNTDNWQDDYMVTAYINSVIDTQYSDHNSAALRGWIFIAGANNITLREAEPVDVEAALESTELPDDLPVGPTPDRVELGSGYMKYDSSSLSSNNKNVLFFHAGWCPSCMAADAFLSIADYSEEDIVILKVNYDTAGDLRKKYGVTQQHTFVQVDEAGNEITKWVGGNDLPSVKAKVK